ncbi:MAG: molybdate ABC transporter substrate-binding protein [Caldilineaceae bacterium]
MACSPFAAPGAQSGAAAKTTTLTVFAAASLTNAFGEIGANFSVANPDTEIVFNFAGSNQLSTQIAEGAPADVFAAANATQMTAALQSGRIDGAAQRVFAHNRLVVVLPGDNPAGLATLEDLRKPGLKIVLAAAEVPAGQYALEFLDKAAASDSLGAGYRDAVLANVVSYETNVRAVLSKVVLGEADAGIVYASDAAAQSDQIQQISIPDELNTIASYPIAPLADSEHFALAQQFVDYVLGPDGQKVLAAYGFAAANGEDK